MVFKVGESACDFGPLVSLKYHFISCAEEKHLEGPFKSLVFFHLVGSIRLDAFCKDSKNIVPTCIEENNKRKRWPVKIIGDIGIELVFLVY